MSDNEFKVSIDPSGAVAGAEATKKAFKSIEDSARRAGQSASASMDKASAAIRRTAQVASSFRGFGGGYGGFGGAASMLGGSSGRIAAMARVGVGKVAGQAAGRTAGAWTGRILGAAGGPAGMIAGSLAGSMLGGALTGGGGGGNEADDNVEQMMVRGISEQRAKSIADLAKRLQDKFKIDSGRTMGAALDANMGDAGGLQSILKDVGINPDVSGSANDALARLNKAAPTVAKSANELAKERFLNTPFMTGVNSFWSGVKAAPGEMLGNIGRDVDRASAWGMNKAADWLGGGYNEDGPGSPSLENDVAFEQKKPKRRGGDGGDFHVGSANRQAKVIISAAKNVPTTARSMAGR